MDTVVKKKRKVKRRKAIKTMGLVEGEMVGKKKRRVKKRVIRKIGQTFVKAYCAKCKSKVEIKDGKIVKTKNGRFRQAGKCKVCDRMTSVFRSAKDVNQK